MPVRRWSRRADVGDRRRIPGVVLAATAAFTAIAGLWSVAAPLTEAPDELAHLELVLHVADRGDYPRYDELGTTAATFGLCLDYGAATRVCPNRDELVTPTSMRRRVAEAAPDKAGRPTWEEAGGRLVVGKRPTQMPQHPPLYYSAMATVLQVERALPGSTWSLDRELALLRLANVALVAPLPLLAWAAVRRLGLDDHVGSVAALAVLAVPQLAHIGSALNNDNLLTLLGAVLAAQLAGVAVGDRSRSTALGVGAVVGLAMLTKAFAVVFPPVVALAYLSGWWVRPPRGQERTSAGGERRPWDAARRVLAAPALAGVVAVASSAWWYLRVRADTGRFTPTVESQRLTEALRPPGFELEPLEFLERFAGNLSQRFWGSFGWYTVRLPGWLTLVCTLALLTAVGVGVWTGIAAEGRRRRSPLLVLLALPALLMAFVFARALDIHLTTGQYQFIQGRYLFAGIIGLAVAAAVAVVRSSGRAAAPVVACGAGLLQGLGLALALRRYWAEPGDGPTEQVRALVAWSGWPGEVVGAMALVAVAASVWLVVEVARSAAGPRLRGAGGPPVGSEPT